MDLSGIITISGKPGVFKIVARSKGGIIVESLIDGKRMPALSTHRVSALEDISIYTYSEDVPLAEIYGKLAEKTGGKESVAPKAGESVLREELKSVLPEYDEDRVYHSDLKKLFSWFNLLAKKGLAVAPKKEEVKEEPKEEKAKKPAAKKTTAEKKPAAKKPAAKKTAAAEKKPAAKKPAAKKAPAKAKTEK